MSYPPGAHESSYLRQVRASGVLRLEEVERPVPEDDEVLVKIHATTVNRTDCGLRSAEFFISRFVTGLLRPKNKILGMELAGEVEAVGTAVTEFEVGDHVFGGKGSGAHAEFVCTHLDIPTASPPSLCFPPFVFTFGYKSGNFVVHEAT